MNDINQLSDYKFFIEKYNKLNINKQKETIDLIKVLLINIENKYNTRLYYKNMYNINITNFDILLINYIIHYMVDLDKIVLFSLTCKAFYNEIKYFITNSNSTVLKIFNENNHNLFNYILENSYYKYSNFQYYFNTHIIPYPNSYNLVNNYHIDNTLIIYNHFFYDKFNYKTNIINFYYRIFRILYDDEFYIYNDKSILNNYFSINEYFQLFGTKYSFYLNNYLYYYSYELHNNHFSNHTLVSCLNNKKINIIRYKFDIYKLLVFIKYKKFNKIIEIINNIEYVYDIDYIYFDNLMNNYKYIMANNNYNRYIKIIFILIYLKYYYQFIIYQKNKNLFDLTNHINIIKINTIDISNYYYNLKNLKPYYFNKYIEYNYFTYINLILNL